MGILAAISIPLSSSLLSGGAMNQVAMEVEGTLDQARQYAVAQNTYVWVTFATQTQNNIDSLTVAVVASTDGTDPGTYGAVPGSNFALVSKVRTFNRVQLKDAGSFTSTQVTSLPATPSVGAVNGLSSNAVFTIQVPGASQTTFSKSVLFTPSGEAHNAVNPIDVIEFALEPAQSTATPNTKNVAVMRMNGLTGQTIVYRE